MSPEDMDLVSLYMQEHPYRFQTVSDLFRQAIREFLAPRVLDPKTATLRVELTGQAFSRLSDMMRLYRNYSKPDNLISEAVTHFAQFKLEEEALYQERVEGLEAQSSTTPTVPSGLVEE